MGSVRFYKMLELSFHEESWGRLRSQDEGCGNLLRAVIAVLGRLFFFFRGENESFGDLLTLKKRVKAGPRRLRGG